MKEVWEVARFIFFFLARLEIAPAFICSRAYKGTQVPRLHFFPCSHAWSYVLLLVRPKRERAPRRHTHLPQCRSLFLRL